MYITVANRWAGPTKTIDLGEKMQEREQVQAADMKLRSQDEKPGAVHPQTSLGVARGMIFV